MLNLSYTKPGFIFYSFLFFLPCSWMCEGILRLIWWMEEVSFCDLVK
jgi:hypothetical protein